MNPEDLEARLTTPFEKVLTTLVDNIEHIESTTYNGSAVVKNFLQPHTSLDRANAQVVGASQFALRLLPPSVQPPEIINLSASSVPILQLGLSGKGLAEQQLNDLALNFVRTQLITVPGAVVPLPYGGKQRQVMINMDHNLMQARNVSPTDVLNAVNAQSLVLPSNFRPINIIVPTAEVLRAFWVGPAVAPQNRDTLLPKLLSSDLRLKKTEEFVDVANGDGIQSRR